MILDATDKTIINQLQGGFPVEENPWKVISEKLLIDEQTLIERIQLMQEAGYISRFGPLYDAQKMGGGLSLAAIKVEEQRFDEVAEMLNQLDEVAHNYQRDHELNMWFVIATESPRQVQQVIQQIETRTGCTVYNMPKQKEYFLGLKLEIE